MWQAKSTARGTRQLEDFHRQMVLVVKGIRRLLCPRLSDESAGAWLCGIRADHHGGDWKPPLPAMKNDVPKVLLMPLKNKDSDRVLQYLFGRGIDYAIVQDCMI